MNISIFQPYSLHEIGQRSNNEDNIYPLKGAANTAQRLFLVCDGVGGSEKGEVASELACTELAAFFAEKGDFVSTERDINAAVRRVQDKIDAYLNAHGTSAKGMACTMTLLHLHEAGATIAHIGDSRVYHIRGGQILFQTYDHKLVNDLVKYGSITPEQALTHPQRNVITRALQAYSIEDTVADVHVINEIQAGDYFFLCTDGILERVTDALLTEILSQKQTDAQKIEAIFALCQGYSRDNFSAYLVQIQAVNGAIPAISVTPSEDTLISLPETIEATENKKPLPKWLLPLLIFAIVSILIIVWANFEGKKEAAPAKKHKDTIVNTSLPKDTSQNLKDSLPKIKDSLKQLDSQGK